VSCHTVGIAAAALTAGWLATTATMPVVLGAAVVVAVAADAAADAAPSLAAAAPKPAKENDGVLAAAEAGVLLAGTAAAGHASLLRI